MKLGLVIAAIAALLAPLSAPAQTADDRLFDGAAGADVLFQSDADETEVVRTGFNLDADYDDPEHYVGIRVEQAWFNPLGQGWEGHERVYLRAADNFGKWKWAANVGTDGHTVLGSVSVHDESRIRKEFFIERDILETSQGLEHGIYHTFAGATADLPLNERNVVTVLAGVQEFTGENVRTHLRANYIHVVKPEWGLSVQLRTRWFRNSDPREFDYYSPRWYAQVLPVVQMRRTTDSGWRLLAAGGLGLQRDSDSDWRRSTYANLQVTSPRVGRGWAVTASFLFSETPTTTGQAYNYVQFAAGVVRTF